MQILGSQIGILLFMIIGGIVIWIIDKARKEKMDNDEANSILGFFTGAGFIFAFGCYFIYACTHPED